MRARLLRGVELVFCAPRRVRCAHPDADQRLERLIELGGQTDTVERDDEGSTSGTRSSLRP